MDLNEFSWEIKIPKGPQGGVWRMPIPRSWKRKSWWNTCGVIRMRGTPKLTGLLLSRAL